MNITNEMRDHYESMLYDLIRKDYPKYSIIPVGKNDKEYRKGIFKTKFIVDLTELKWSNATGTAYSQFRRGLFSWSDLKKIKFPFQLAVDESHKIVFYRL